MKILWAVEPVIPQIAELTGGKPSIAGGWLVSVCNGLLTNEANSLIVCYRAAGEHASVTKERFTGWSFEQGPLRYSPENERFFANLLRKEKPDVIHIWGTEYPFSLAMLNAAEQENMLDRVVVSIQGLTSVYAQHFTAGLSGRVVNGYTFRDFLRGDNIRQQQKKFALRGTYEIAALKKARHIIGRTGWDRACVRQINPDATYHFCNETLRPAFYEDTWRFDRCEQHSIFVSQGNYPIKGLHQALEALAILKSDFPDVKLYTTGADPRAKGLAEKLRRSSYARYLAKQIRILGLDENVVFLGGLSANDMKERYLGAHVALNPSSIENSSNAIGEAMLLGTPVVASYVGGTPDIVTDRKEGLLYPFDAPYLLAEAVRNIFEDGLLTSRLSMRARQTARLRHDAKTNLSRLDEIYTLLTQQKDTEQE